MIADYKRCFLTCDSSSQGIRSSKGRKRALFQPLNPSPEKLTIKYFSFCGGFGSVRRSKYDSRFFRRVWGHLTNTSHQLCKSRLEMIERRFGSTSQATSVCGLSTIHCWRCIGRRLYFAAKSKHNASKWPKGPAKVYFSKCKINYVQPVLIADGRNLIW